MNFLIPHWFGKKIWLPRGYRLKLFLTFLAVLILCGGSLILLFGQFQRQNLKAQIFRNGRFVSSLLARNLETPLFFMDMTQIKANVEAVLTAPDIVAVIVYDQDGKRILSRFAPQAEKELSRPEALSHFSKSMTEHTPNDEDDPNAHGGQEHFFVFCNRIVTAGQSGDQTSLYFDTGKEHGAATGLGGVQVIISRAQYQRSMTEIVRRSTFVFLFFLPVSLLMAFVLTRDLVRPLRNLVAALQTRLGKTKDEEEGKTTDELDQLEISFTHMVSRLDSSFATIARMNETLEDAVAARTAELTTAMRELKEAQIQLVQSEKMVAVGQLVAGVAHEVNNTTNFVTGALPPLGRRLDELRLILTSHREQGCLDSPRVDELIQSIDLLVGNIREGARRTSKIVTDLKNFSRPDDDLTSQVDINQCLESTLSLALPEYRHKIEVSTEFATDLPLVFGSQGQLNQVFMNLIINAIHAQPDKGTLLIRTFSRKDGVHVIFKDSGPGIHKQIQGKIFDPFFTTKAVGKGTGLGLSVSFGIISKHGGKILVHSEVGQGAEFEVVLPAGRNLIASQHEESGT